MKRMRTWAITLICLLLIAGTVYAAGGWSASTGILYTSQSVVAKPAGLCGITVHTNGVTPSTVNLHDGSSTSAVSRWSITVPGTSYSSHVVFNPPIQFNAGIYYSAPISGISEAPTAVIEYIQQR